MTIEVRVKECKTALSPSRLPGLDWALNPYRGCSHACAYCYAQDVTRFEMSKPWGSVVEVKAGIVQCLTRELERGAKEGVFGVGTVTDPYQPFEKKFELTRGCLAVLKRYSRSVSVLTKSDLILRDLDILQSWPRAEVGISIGTLDEDLARVLEPGAPLPERRLEALKSLVDSGVSAYLMAAPIIFEVNGSKDAVENLVRAARDSGLRRIIWDKLNPKPLANARIKNALAEAGLGSITSISPHDVKVLRQSLRDACLNLGLELSEGF